MFYYECVMTVDVAYMAPVHRQDQKFDVPLGGEIPLMQHNLRFKPADVFKERPADIMCTEKKIHRSFVEEYEKQVSRPKEKGGYPAFKEREMRPKMTKIKFRLMDPSEVTESIKKRAITVVLRECDLAGSEKKETNKKK